MVSGAEITFLITLLVLSGFFSGSEVALISISKSKVRHMVDKKRFGSSYVQKLKEDSHRMLATILIGNNIVNVGASALATSIAINLFQNFAVGIATGIMTLLILVFGEITPKSIASEHSETISRLVAAPIWYLSLILAPILDVLTAFLNQFIKLFGIKAKQITVTEEEIISMVKTAEEEGTIKEIEKEMIHSIFDFDDIDVGGIAIPRTDMILIESKATVKEALRLILRKKYSRIPVYEKNRDNIIGIIYARDVMACMEKRKDTGIAKLIKKPFFVPETKKISSLLRQFQKRKEHMAIVVDEHGSVTGLVTLEDILEEIVGEIMDETDKIDPPIKQLKDNSWMVKGKAEIEEVNEKLHMKLKGKDYDTLSGFILKHTGRIPKEGEEIVYKKFRLKIEEVGGNRINKIRVEKT